MPGSMEAARSAAAEAKLKRQIPHTRADALRDYLEQVENHLGKLKDLSKKEALEVLEILDKIADAYEEIQATDISIESEEARLQTIFAKLQNKKGLFIQRIGGSAALAKARQERQATADRWWWSLDVIQADERKIKARQWLVRGVIVALVLVMLGWVYNRFFRPSPEFEAAYSHRQHAENLAIGSDFEGALSEVNQAITYAPEDPALYVFKGILELEIRDEAEAESSFKIAQEGYEQPINFYLERASFYLLMDKAELLLADAERVIEMDPDRAVAYLMRGQAYDLMGDLNSAITNFELASEVAERTGDIQTQVVARVNLSQAYERSFLSTPVPVE